MKLASVNLTTNKNISNNNKNKNSYKSPSFKGITNLLVGLDAAMKSSRAIQFTVEDMCGTNFPRSYMGLTAGYKYTHKLNWLAFFQEATREFLTGPTMCLVPLAVITGAKKVIGKSSNTHIENINNLSYLMSNSILKENNGEVAKLADNFFYDVASDMLKTTVGKADVDLLKDDDIKSLAHALGEYAQKSGARCSLFKNPSKFFAAGKAKKESMANVQNVFEQIIKKTRTSYGDSSSFLNASYTIKEGEIGTTSIKNYVGYITAYMEDFAKHFSKDGNLPQTLNKDMLKSFQNSWIFKRNAIALSMFVLAGVFMSQIPKLYTKVSGKVNPNASAIYDEAKKKEGGSN